MTTKTTRKKSQPIQQCNAGTPRLCDQNCGVLSVSRQTNKHTENKVKTLKFIMSV